MINYNTIISSLINQIGIQYESNGEINAIGWGQFINYTHPLLTPQAIGALAGISLRLKDYHGEYDENKIYNQDQIVKYKNRYFISLINENHAEPVDGDNWQYYDPIQQNLLNEFRAKLYNIIAEIYTLIKSEYQTEDILQSGYIFEGEKDYEISTINVVQSIKIIPRKGVLKINNIKFTAPTSTSITFTVINLDTYIISSSTTVVANKTASPIINQSSSNGFVIKISSSAPLFVWKPSNITNKYTYSQRGDFNPSDVNQYNNNFFTPIDKFCCEINATNYCDLTNWFVNNLEMLLPYIVKKMAHSWLKTIYYNGAARSNKFEANEKIKSSEIDLFGDKMNISSLVADIKEMERTLISRFGYDNPCLHKAKSRIRYESV